MRNLYKSLFFSLLVMLVSSAQGQMFWNQACSFPTGTSTAYVAIPNSPSLNPTDALTIEMWVNTPGGQFDTYIDKNFSTNYSFGITSGNLLRLFKNGVNVVGTTAVPANVWAHIAVTCNATTGAVVTYINGAVADNLTIATGNFVANADSVFLGKLSNGGNIFNGGLMDNVRLWNRVLTSVEIQRNYRTALGATGGLYGGLVLSMTFEEQDAFGTLFGLTDWSGNGNNGLNRAVVAVDLSNRPQTYETINQGVDFDGALDYLAGPDNPAVSPTAGVTLEAWIYPRSVTNCVLIQKGPPTGGTGTNYRLALLSGAVYGGINGNFSFNSIATVTVGRWWHVAFTYDGATSAYVFYINGVATNSGTNAQGAINNGTDSLYIGGSASLTQFDGIIDEVRIASYVKTTQQIRDFVYRSIEDLNEPNVGATNVVYNLDGLAVDACNDGGPRLFFNGDAKFSSPSTVSNVPVAPLNRADGQSFPNGFHMKTSNRRIPETGTSGNMTPDSLSIGQSVTMTDVNLVLLTNHTFDSDMDITLFAPNGDSVNVCFDFEQLGQDDNIITVFDDNADSSLVNIRYTSCTPRIRPQSSLNTVFVGDNAQGVWRLKITDDAAGDTGRVYAWGIQINNQTIVGVQEVAGFTPQQFSLDQNYPNPFNPTTAIQFSVPTQSLVTVKIYDILGREVRTLVNEVKTPGTYKAMFDGNGLASGTYFYRMEAGSFIETKKLILLK